MDIRDEAMQLRNEKHQMIKTGLNAKMENSHDLAVVYTPGVAAPCLAIKEEEDKSLELTWRGNVVAVISDGTRVLGLGDIGPAAAMPVMLSATCAFLSHASASISSKKRENICCRTGA